MADLFSWTSAQFGLAVGLLIVAVVILSRALVVKDRESRAQILKELEETKLERDYYRDKWVETLGVAEVGSEAAKRLAGGGRRRPGGR